MTETINLCSPETGDLLIYNPSSQCYESSKNEVFPVVNKIPRFVSSENYTSNFGFQWNLFSEIQIDSRDGSHDYSLERLEAETNWKWDLLRNKNLLEVGSGAGRFTDVMLRYSEANIYSVDSSNAVEANLRNNQLFAGRRLHLFQADIYNLPFPTSQFDITLCLGVLQHTPDFKKSLKSLVEMTAVGGDVIVDFYEIRGFWTFIHAKYLLRPLLKRLEHPTLLLIVRVLVSIFFPLSLALNYLSLGFLCRFLPIADVGKTIPTSQRLEQAFRWALLDTFDMFSPTHDHPQRIVTVKRWLEEFGVEVKFADRVKFGKDGHEAAVVRGTKLA